ncbi:MAG TPA: hypothetical protein VMD79_10640 [Solirubrobacteraceae bacterium]|nr:hypothetical protein [Solirubrobacteraceae bacterium]
MKSTQLIAGFAALALLVAGCGGGAKSPTVASLGTRTSKSGSSTGAGGSPSSSGGSTGSSGSSGGSTASSGGSPGSQAVAFVACMRAHGVANFPEPRISTHGDEVSVAVAVTPAITGNPRFKPAQRACMHLLPEGGPGGGANQQISPREQSQYLKAAACIRAHGIPKFPDPTFSGGGVHVSQTPGFNPHSPQVRAAEEACQSLIPGGLHGNH